MSAVTPVLEREIGEQPEALAHTMEACLPEARALGSDLARRDVSYVLIAARGSSDNAGVYATYLFPAFNGLPVALATPSLYTFYHRPPRLRGALVIGISQSGQSEDVVEVLTDARKQGALTAAVTAEGSSPLARAAERLLHLQTGSEKAVAATKTFTSSLAALAVLSAALANDTDRLEELKRLPDIVSQTIQSASGPASLKAERYRYADRCVVIGRGYSYCAAMEIALKLKELTYVTAEPYSSADFQHGPMAMLQPGFPVVLVAPRGALTPHLTDFAGQLSQREAEVIAISDVEEILGRANVRLPLPAGCPEWLAPVASVIPGQLLGLHLASAKGLDPDRPRGLHKVTITR